MVPEFIYLLDPAAELHHTSAYFIGSTDYPSLISRFFQRSGVPESWNSCGTVGGRVRPFAHMRRKTTMSGNFVAKTFIVWPGITSISIDRVLSRRFLDL